MNHNQHKQALTHYTATLLPQKKSAFTLIELLVVIAIIGILSSVIFGSMNTARDRGKAARIVGDVRVIRDALQFRYSEATQYPTETELIAGYAGLTASPITIEDMISADVFGDKFTAAPIPPIGSGGYGYDADASDGTTVYPIESCGTYTNNEFGVNLFITNAISDQPNVVSQLDELVDSGDGLDCGRVRRATASDNTLLYNISVIPTLFP